MNDRIAQALTRLFDCHRIVFWYDVNRELRSEFEALDLASIEKIEIVNDEFSVKYRILREQPHQKFLLYREGAPPVDIDNWLLDIQLAQGEFRGDQVSLWLSELELGFEFTGIIREHIDFFKAIKRRENLKQMLRKDDTESKIKLKILSVCAETEPVLEEILKSLLSELAEKTEDKINLIQRCNVETFFWDQIKREYGYSSKLPGIKDFAIELFKSCYAMRTEGESRLNSDSLVFLNHWKDSRQFGSCFEILSDEYAEVLSIEQDLIKRDFRELIELDYFQLIDKKIISDLVKAINSKTVSRNDVDLWTRQKEKLLVQRILPFV